MPDHNPPRSVIGDCSTATPPSDPRPLLIQRATSSPANAEKDHDDDDESHLWVSPRCRSLGLIPDEVKPTANT